MKRYIFHSTIDEQSVEKLIDFLNENPKESIDIYFSSGGGRTGLAIFLANYINERESPVYVHLGDDLHSCAFLFAFLLEKNIVFNPYLQTYSIIHACSAEIDSKQPGRQYALESVDKSNEYQLEQFTFLTLAEQIDFKDGKDIYLNYNRLKKIFLGKKAD
jgi:hypothetical protein